MNNHHRDGQRFFLFGIKSECGIDIWIQIFIWDDEWGRFNRNFVITIIIAIYF